MEVTVLWETRKIIYIEVNLATQDPFFTNLTVIVLRDFSSVNCSSHNLMEDLRSMDQCFTNWLLGQILKGWFYRFICLRLRNKY